MLLLLLLILYPDTDFGSPSQGSSLAVSLAPCCWLRWFCLIFSTLALHMIHLRGRRFWATAIWIVRTKHFRHTTWGWTLDMVQSWDGLLLQTWWLQGRVCMHALFVPHTTHSSSWPRAASWSWPSILQRRLSWTIKVISLCVEGLSLTILPVSLPSSSSRWCPWPLVLAGGSWGNLRYCWNLRRSPNPE